jgi:hypothetical protein
MDRNEFYSSLANLPVSYNFNVEGNTIVGSASRGNIRGVTLNPITARPATYMEQTSVKHSRPLATLGLTGTSRIMSTTPPQV